MPDSLIPLGELKNQLGLTSDQDDDDGLIQSKIDAAENHIDRLLGYRMRERFPVTNAGDPVASNVPASLLEAVRQLAAWWFENREAATDMNRVLPFGVTDLINEYREWTF
ncbi:head-tail connector protein [Paracoccus sp. MBLB3053]|uniref:Head-tail connector protein n=1 Tax=Paracoccus aurantius TaxID=3073814 RepID=A0ABU2HSC1_9RHOB|nr:head-tail connector protein [Paracoccus sp. MBLB3053]MDS9467943.1 head-tail connector protein [Paracoccus sp. MBLB3053]